MHDRKRQQRLKLDILGVQFNNVTMLDMIEHVKTFSHKRLRIICLS